MTLQSLIEEEIRKFDKQFEDIHYGVDFYIQGCSGCKNGRAENRYKSCHDYLHDFLRSAMTRAAEAGCGEMVEFSSKDTEFNNDNVNDLLSAKERFLKGGMTYAD